MFITFSTLLSKVGGFRIGLSKRIASKNVLWVSLIYLTVVTFQLMWYSALLVGWLLYAFIYGCLVGTKKLFNILADQHGKLKAFLLLSFLYTVIIFVIALVSTTANTPTNTTSDIVPTTVQTTANLPTKPTKPTTEEITTQSTTEDTIETTSEAIIEAATEATTEATIESTEATTEATNEPTEAPASNTTDYVLNTSSGKFHYSWCSSVNQMKESNKSYFTGTREEVIQYGYSPCGRCCP